MSEMSPRQQALPFSAGRDWLQSAITLIRLQTLRLLVLGLVLQFIGGLSQMGVFGLLFLLAMPVFSAGMLQGLHEAGQGGRPSLLVLFRPFGESSRLGRLLVLGLLGLTCMLMMAALAMAGGMGDLDPALVSRLEAGEVQAVNELDPAFIRRVLFGLLAGLLIAGTLSFYAVPLVWFGDETLASAIGKGLLGMVRQWRGLLIMGLLLGLLGIPVAMLSAFVLATQAVTGETSAILTLFMLILAVAYQLLLFANQYTSFIAIFGMPTKGHAADTTLSHEDGAGSDQLVA